MTELPPSAAEAAADPGAVPAGLVLQQELPAQGAWRRWRASDPAGLPLDFLRIDAPAEPWLAERHRVLTDLLPRCTGEHLCPGARGGVDGAGRLWLAGSLVTGPTLAERLASGPLPVHAAVGLVRTLAEALAPLHAVGLAHLGVAAERVVLQRIPCVEDDPFPFRVVLTGLGQVLPPDEIGGDDPRADVRALSALLGRCLLGRAAGPADLERAGVRADVVLLARDLAEPDPERPVDCSRVRAVCDGVIAGPAGAHRGAAWVAVLAAALAALAALAWSLVAG